MAPDARALRRVLLSPEQLLAGALTLPPEAAKHLAVLRLKPGDPLELLDGQGRRALATLTDPRTVQAEAPSPAPGPSVDPALALTLLFAVPKGDAPDLIVRACTELGVRTFAPVTTERTVAQPPAKRTDRWRRIAESATLQSGRYVVPEVLPPRPLPEALDALPDDVTLRLAPWVPERSTPFPEAADHQGAALLIGPEGGFTDGEADLARAHGFVTVTLGPRILRTPTAAIAATALLLR